MSGRRDTVEETANILAGKVAALPGSPRKLVAVAGAPGSGKSTLAEALVEALGAQGAPAVLMPMDGFHLDNRLLEARGLLARKGAPETFDFGGFASALGRVRRDPSVILPVFDRTRDIAIAGAREIGPEARFVVVEGNYLLLDEAPWRQLADMWDFSVFLDVPEAELERRLFGRWLGFGYTAEQARDKALGNDIPNARRVARHRISATELVGQTPGPA